MPVHILLYSKLLSQPATSCANHKVLEDAALVCRDLCISTGRSLQRLDTHLYSGAIGCSKGLSINVAVSQQHAVVNWRRMFFRQSYALSFNGINDYVALPVGSVNRHLSGQPAGTGSLLPGTSFPALTIDMLVLAHSIPARPPSSAGAKSCTAVIPPAGGVLFSCQDREFGRSRRAARLESIALLYIGTDGCLYSGLGAVKSSSCLADGRWHRITLTMRLVGHAMYANFFIDGVLDCTLAVASFNGLPSYPVLGSGVTEGCTAGSSTPVYNCHSFHGLIDELRLWARELPAHEV